MNRIKEYLLLYKMTQGECARRAGINDATLRAYIRGQCIPNVYVAYRIADVFGVMVEDIFPPGQGVI